MEDCSRLRTQGWTMKSPAAHVSMHRPHQCLCQVPRCSAKSCSSWRKLMRNGVCCPSAFSSILLATSQLVIQAQRSAPRLAGWDDARLRVAVVKLQDGRLLPSTDAQVAVRSSATLGAQKKNPSLPVSTLSPLIASGTLLTPRPALSLLQALRCCWAVAVARRRMPCGLACSS